MSVLQVRSPDSVSTEKQIKDYILSINKAVQNVFNSLDPDDNFSEEEINRYNETDLKIAMLQLNVAGFETLYAEKKENIESSISAQKDRISLKVRKNDLVNQLNLEKDAIDIKGNRIEIATQNFVVTDTKAYAKGNITATGGTIAGWTISGSSWNGGSSSRIKVNKITADSGSAGTISATGDVTINATFKGNFDEILCTGATFNDISCSCMQQSDNSILTCGALRVYKTKRGYKETVPSSATHPDEDEGYDYPKRYNTNDAPEGGLIVDGNIEVKEYYSKLAGITWSDRRLKRNIAAVTRCEAQETLFSLLPVEFTYKDKNTPTNGYIAQEVPEEFRQEARNGMLGVKYQSVMCCLDRVIKDNLAALKEALYDRT